MADILAFRQREHTDRAPRRRSRKASAEIIIFPGVRYERWSDEPTTPKPKRGRQGRRSVTAAR